LFKGKLMVSMSLTGKDMKKLLEKLQDTWTIL